MKRMKRMKRQTRKSTKIPNWVGTTKDSALYLVVANLILCILVSIICVMTLAQEVDEKKYCEGTKIPFYGLSDK